MKTLILIRHAKSSWKDHTLRDIDRPLNKRGKKDAPFMGKKLKEANIIPDLILSSPANRAYTTAKIIANKTGYPNEGILIKPVIYAACIQDLITLIKEIDNKHSIVFIFGHNPEFTGLANHFNNKEYIVNVPTCGIVTIGFDHNNWNTIEKDNGTVKSFIYPKLYREVN